MEKTVTDNGAMLVGEPEFLFLFPTHPFWSDFKNPLCPVCRSVLTQRDYLARVFMEDGRHFYMHKGCFDSQFDAVDILEPVP